MRLAALSVPSALGLSPNPRDPRRPRGTWRAPAALRDAGLLPMVGARDAGTLAVPGYVPAPDRETGIYNRDGIAIQTRALALEIGRLLDTGENPCVIGGDCGVLLGAGLALRRRGRHGLVFLDGHLDFRHARNSPRLSAVAGEDLAIVTGRGLTEHSAIDGLSPYFLDSDVLALGEREHDPATADIHDTQIDVVDLDSMRAAGPAAVADRIRTLAARLPGGFWLHVDVDVLDSSLMPAVDSPQPDGMAADELTALIHDVARLDGLQGLDVTVYDPELDPDGRCASLVCRILANALGPNHRSDSPNQLASTRTVAGPRLP
jgi:arginase